MPRPVRWIGGLFLAGLGLCGVTRLHTDSFVKENWRAATAYVQEHEAAGDALALRQSRYLVPWRYYYRGTLDSVAVTLDRRTTPLEDIAARHERLWLVFPATHFLLERDETEPMVRAWITDHVPREVVTYSGLTVMLFDLGVAP